MKKLKKIGLSALFVCVLVANFLLVPTKVKAAKEPWGCMYSPQYYCDLMGQRFLNVRPLY